MKRNKLRFGPLLTAMTLEVILVYQICCYQIRHGSFYHIETSSSSLTVPAGQPVMLAMTFVNDAAFNLTVTRDHEHYGTFYVKLFRADGSRVTQRPSDWNDLIYDSDDQVVDPRETLSGTLNLSRLYVFGAGRYKALISPYSEVGSRDQHLLVGPFPGRDAVVDIDITP